MIKRSKKSVQAKLLKGNDDVLDYYMSDIRKIPLLSREDEVKLATEAANGNKAARDKLIEANLRFVIRIAKRYQGQGLPLSDLINEGNIGLIRAASHFDVNRGFHFISYAVWWVRQSILTAIAEKSRMIRLPVQWNSKLFQIEKSKGQNYQSSENDLAEIAEQLGLDVEKAKEIAMLGQDIVSLEQPGNDGESYSSIRDFLVSENEASPEERVMNLTLQEEINHVLECLGKKEAEIIRARFGLDNQCPKSLEEIGDRFHMSKEGIRQIENKALRHLREPELRKRLESYVA
ncbi:MAG: RNA polymerase sigma factor RpoD/SigA [Treponema sp.]|jgi:RNA polymerase primary sigma factor|nr:RNA polymerase sigma factor RpoD/SigA [Treponema sp.]